ncbi:hypothetical protein [Cellulosimicrobium sp. NPDC055967]|uniref:hypothetical protein n=1 Tax=Cellulosimicrobium sp. NPDC055967 TaxID=3345670 RepID=UPI0035DDB4CC
MRSSGFCAWGATESATVARVRAEILTVTRTRRGPTSCTRATVVEHGLAAERPTPLIQDDWSTAEARTPQGGT